MAVLAGGARFSWSSCVALGAQREPQFINLFSRAIGIDGTEGHSSVLFAAVMVRLLCRVPSTAFLVGDFRVLFAS